MVRIRPYWKYFSMGGVFMKKSLKRVGICMLITAFFWYATVLADRNQLNETLIRLHVVANSDSPEDQKIKLQVRDAVTASLKKELANVADVEKAKAYLQDNLPKIRQIANETLEAAGFHGEAVVSLCQEAFDTRYYDTFTLPAGIYEALRITIGAGEGQNWWCVVFPALCVPETTEAFADTAAGAGFSDSLNGTLTGAPQYELRFFLLDALGRLENMLWEG